MQISFNCYILDCDELFTSAYKKQYVFTEAYFIWILNGYIFPVVWYSGILYIESPFIFHSNKFSLVISFLCFCNYCLISLWMATSNTLYNKLQFLLILYILLYLLWYPILLIPLNMDCLKSLISQTGRPAASDKPRAEIKENWWHVVPSLQRK